MDKEDEIRNFIEEITNKIKPVTKEAQLSYWNAALSGKKEDYDKYEELQVKLEELFHNKEDFEKSREFLKQDADELSKRQIDILYRAFLGSQGDINLIKEIIKKSTEIEKKFNTFRAKVNDKEYTDNQIKDILKEENDSEKLREFWEASKKQGELVEKELIEIIKLRNELAKSLGFENYHTMSLELSEQKVEDISSVYDKLAELTEIPFRNLKNEMDSILAKRYNIEVSELKPWHYHDLFFQEGPRVYKIDLDEYYSEDVIEFAKKFYKSIGLDAEDILDRSDLYEKPGKYQHACCIDIDREGDVRIIQNTKNDYHWMSTTLHELGHAVYDKNINKNLPYFLRSHAHIFVTEAIAMLMGRLVENKNFIEKYCSKELDEEISREIFKSLKSRQLVFARWAQVMFNFEKELYKNPEQDLNKLWYNIVKKYQMLNFFRDKPDWASKIHFVSSPAYYHNYLLGELLASQLNNYIAKNIIKTDSLKIDYSDNREIGTYLKEKIFSPGRKYKWKELIEKATGEKLNPEYFVKEFVDPTG
ncbi:MAG: M2 family metallopeptidase [Candidatus Pacearchaeota archaeon]